MLPAAALTHFRHLLDERTSSVARSLEDDIKALNRREPGSLGKGYVARLGGVYARQLQPVASGIAESLKEVHARFDLGLSDDVQSEILSLADRSYQSWVSAMEGSFARHLGRFGLPATSLDWSLSAAASHAGLLNSLRRYFWDLKSLPPMKQETTSTTVINFNAPVGMVQTGDGAVAHARSGLGPADVAAAAIALARFRDALRADAGVPADLRADLEGDVIRIAEEVQATAPSGGRITRWIGGIGASVQTIASLQPAWQAVLTAMKALGL